MNDGEAKMIAECLAGVDRRVQTLGEMIGRLTTGCLDSGTYTFDANGVMSRDYQVPYAAIAITNRTAARIVCEAATPRDAPPVAGLRGPGLWTLEPGESSVQNVAGYAVTVYGGQLGDRIELQVFGRPQAPSWAAAAPQASTTVGGYGTLQLTSATAPGTAVAAIAAAQLPAGLYEVEAYALLAAANAPTTADPLEIRAGGTSVLRLLHFPAVNNSAAWDSTPKRAAVRLDGQTGLSIAAALAMTGAETQTFNCSLAATRVGP